MPTRRHLLGLFAIGLVGCGSSPRVEGAAASAPATPSASLSPRQATAAAALSSLRASLAAVEADEAWRAAATAQVSQLLGRVNSLDPLSSAPSEAFALPEPQPGEQTAAAEIAAEALEACAGETSDGATRLAYASASAAATSLRHVGPAPVEGATPQRLPEVTLTEAATIALGHAWALVYGLGVALGRLPAEDETHAQAAARLDPARILRGELREAVGGEVPTQPAAFELPTAMDTPETVRAGLAALELNLLEGYAGLVAADPDPRWRARLRELALVTQGWGGALPYWPGWTAQG